MEIAVNMVVIGLSVNLESFVGDVYGARGDARDDEAEVREPKDRVGGVGPVWGSCDG